MPENSNPNDLPNSRMSSLGLETTPRKATPGSGRRVFVGIAAGVIAYLILAVLLNQLIGGIVGSILLLPALVVAVVVGRQVYRTLQRRAGYFEEEEKEDTSGGS